MVLSHDKSLVHLETGDKNLNTFIFKSKATQNESRPILCKKYMNSLSSLRDSTQPGPNYSVILKMDKTLKKAQG